MKTTQKYSKMKSLIFILSLIVVCNAGKFSGFNWSGQGFPSKPSISPLPSNSLQTAPYEVISKGANYELRSYSRQKWVTKTTTSNVYDSYGGSSFMQLFGYISGRNSAGVKIEMTTPVLMGLYSRPCAFCSVNSTMSFYLPSEFQSNPPKPLDEGIKIETLQFQVYVKRFGGYPKLSEYMDQAQELYFNLLEDGVSKENLLINFFYMVGYDEPWKFYNRRNEVWIVNTLNL